MPRSSIWCLALLLLPVAEVAAAGAWPRAEGDAFLSFTGERDRDGNTYAGVYGEYGLRPRSTLGFQFDHADAGETGVLVWLQRALDDGSGTHRWTVSLGLGAIARDDDTILPVAQFGAAWGRGVETRFGSGWLTVETRLKVAGAMRDPAALDGASLQGTGYLGYLTPELSGKADATLGLHLSDATMFVNQLRLENRDDTGFSAGLATSIVRDLGGPAKLELGVITPLAGGGNQALKIGTWLEF